MLSLLQKNKWERLLLMATGLCVLIAAILSFIVPPGADTDPCWGFIVMHGMEQGHHFNQLIMPGPANIADDHAEFLAWWSPGQYLLPYFFKLLLNINTGHSVSLTVALCNILGLAGFYKLFIRLNFNAGVAAVSTAFIASQLFFTATFTYYSGGELLLFAFIGWFLYGCFLFEKVTWRLLLFLFLASFIGLFAKSSFLWAFAAGTACCWINISSRETGELLLPKNIATSSANGQRISIWVKNGLFLAVPFISSLFILYVFYLSKGITPALTGGVSVVKAETFGFPLASPFLSAFSVDELFSGLICQDGGSLVSHQMAVLIVFVFLFLSLTFLVLVMKFSPGKKYLVAFLTFYITGVLFFSFLFLNQSEVSCEGRHFRVIGILAIPGLVYLAFKTKLTTVLFFAVWLFFIYTSSATFLRELEGNRDAAKGNLGISQQLYDKNTMNAILKLDRDQAGKATFVMLSSDIAAEVRYNRVIAIDTGTKSWMIPYHGQCGNLYILMPADFISKNKADSVLSCFTGYHNFSSKQLSPDFYLYSANH